MELGSAITLAGVALAFVGFVFFRRPGVPLLFFGPVWRARRYVTPGGAALWVGGCCVAAVGMAVTLWSQLGQPH